MLPAFTALSTPRHLARHCLASALALACCTAQAEADLEVGQLSLEDLMKVEVTGVSRKAQRLTDTAAAAFVLSAEDIQRSGATSLPEVLRLVPGLEVARIGPSRWAVSARGFNSRFANKLQVQIDGRSVYSPLFSGVFWEAEDVLLDDIERIEVVRGPGAALWGANAVNGVINIITRSARRTQGDLASLLGGDEERFQVAARHGAALDDDSAWRVWAKSGSHREGLDLSGQRSSADWRYSRVGLRWDRDLDAGARMTVDAGLHDGRSGETLQMPSLSAPYVLPKVSDQINRGAHVLGRLEWTGANGAQRSLQSSLDHSGVDMQGTLKEWRTTLDLDFQSRQAVAPEHDLVWGAGYRYSQDHIDTTGAMLKLAPERSHLALLSGFVHDEITVLPEQLKLILGTKIEHNSDTGFEWQPNLRALWTPAPQQTFWAAVSRAVRTPSRAERDASVNLSVIPAGTPFNPGPLPVMVHVLPSNGLAAERVLSTELGYRTQLAQRVSLDLAAFQARYAGLRSATSVGSSLDFSGAVPYVRMDSITSNTLSATTRGIELAVDWHLMPTWRLQASASTLRVRADRIGDPTTDANAETLEGSSPRHQVALRSSLDLPRQQQLDLRVRRVAERATIGVPAYTGLDLRWAWRPTRELELSAVGENLLGAHAEANSEPLPSQRLQIPRGAYLKLRWQF